MTIGLLVTARMGSQRLSDKHLREVGGRPALSHLLARIEQEFGAELRSGAVRALIATGNEARNRPLCELTTGSAVSVFFGDDDNVPLRHLQAAQQLGLSAIVAIDGDDLFCAPQAMRDVHNALRDGTGLTRTVGLPLGMNVFGYSTAVLAEALQGAPAALLETGWGRIFDAMPMLDIALACPHAEQIRATLDYDEDLAFFDRCVREIAQWDTLPTAALVGEIVARGLHTINFSANEKYWENFAMHVSAEKVLVCEPGAESSLEPSAKSSTEPGTEPSFSQRLHAVIPGGAHTYSRGDDQYPSNAPQILEGGKGAFVWSPDGRRFLDYGMALRAVSIGYAEPAINQAAIRGLELGNSLTRASTIELAAAERLVSLVDSVDMVKFTKNGSTATSAAVKLARAFTGRDLVARCAQHPFFSFDDWFIGSTPITKGIPASTIEQTKTFNFNDIASLQTLIDRHPDEIACVILEPAASDCPATNDETSGCCNQAVCTRHAGRPANYLQQVEALCRRHGIVFILDETITGFRWHMKGAQHVYGVTPDLSCFGKAMANGFSVAAVAGRRELMELGSTDKVGQERLFLLSTTHGAEMSGLSAFLATMDFLEDRGVIAHLWKYGADLIAMFNRVAAQHGLQRHLKAAGPAANPYYATLDHDGAPWFALRTLFAQEMIRHGVLMPWMAFSYRHGDAELKQTEVALQQAMSVCARAVVEGVDKYLVGPAIKPVFRRHN